MHYHFGSRDSLLQVVLLRDAIRASRWLAICGQLSLGHDPRLLETAPETTDTQAAGNE